ncbi:hypothetical protein CesoFtcFv8_014769 [Champsocephalus esox]|uniref:Uncharacterized protein n=1 Tax=Champsocephalus esox TaxID=159716 RepID=A0AAN8BR70_9TELE|nr:hypothetical protein CesoFtcFv8_014769 [Champsocephalus esox]
MQACSSTVPLALIFQQRHSIRQWPCHCPFPRDTDPVSAWRVPPLAHHHWDGGKHSADLGAELAFVPSIPRSLPEITHPLVPPHHIAADLPSRGRSRERGRGDREGWKERRAGECRGKSVGGGRGNGNKMSRGEGDRQRGCVGGLRGAD